LLDDLGIEYFEDPLSRLEKAQTTEALISTGWKSVDAVIGGGVGRQELITVLAPSGGGKSVTMANFGCNFLQQGLNGVYITIEMRDMKVAQRIDQMITGMSSHGVTMNKTKVAHELEMFSQRHKSRFFIKRMREGVTNANHIIAYLRELEATKAFWPDFIIVDYLDIIQSARKVDVSNMFLKDQYVSEEIRGIGFDYNAIMVSGSQLGKHATDAINDGRKMHQGDVQGGSSKTNTSDLMIATVKTDAMHEAGEYRFEFPKARNSDAANKTVMMKWNKESLKISDYDAPELTLKKKERTLEMADVVPGKKQTLTIDDLLKP
jgi:archaellum biogenesis ATPase FlaH